MYLIDTQITINWEIMPYAESPELSALDLVITKPDGTSEYLSSPILVDDYIPTTATTNGLVAYRVTPDFPGLWKVSLVIGDNNNHQILSQVDMFVFSSLDSTPEHRVKVVNPHVPTPTTPVLLIVKSLILH